MAAYSRVYDSRHLQADCQEPGSAPEPYSNRVWATFLTMRYNMSRALKWSTVGEASAKCEISFLFAVYLYYIMKAVYER